MTAPKRLLCPWIFAMPEVYAMASIPEPDAYAFALSQPFVTDHQRRLLLAHRNAANRLTLVADLAIASKVGSPNSIYGKLGHSVADFLNLHPARYSPTSRLPLWTTALAEVGRASSRQKWYWRMYPQVGEAIDRLGWVV